MAAHSLKEDLMSQVFNENGIYIALVLVTFAIFWLSNNKGKNPPSRGGLLPWIGCAITFGKAPLLFIEESRKKAGVRV